MSLMRRVYIYIGRKEHPLIGLFLPGGGGPLGGGGERRPPGKMGNHNN